MPPKISDPIIWVTFQLAYPAVMVRTRLATIGPKYEEAGRDLGESQIQAFRRAFPMLLPTIFASTMLFSPTSSTISNGEPAAELVGHCRPF